MEFEKAVRLQSKLILEEAQETFDAADVNDYTEILDGCCDVLFTLSQLIELLEQGGFDVEGAYQAVINNNNNKVFNSFYEACEVKERL
jgi:phosphoribosyl-ATP pyrophosphohydrolase